MSILGIDYGAKKIGLAKSDQFKKLAVPLGTVFNNSKSEVLAKLKNICQQENIDEIVVGVPVSLSTGNSGLLREIDFKNQQVKEVLAFIDWLKTNFSLPIGMEDERLSTKMANRLEKDLVKKNGGDDPIAAMLVLQSYLDRNNN
ncbi:MAG: hypothetical protein A3A24_02755 [Candidatus Buchananbacteria bacterium RIFCSPLOWO2_01_FULL_46_12]|uniref:Putative pre-16S rRNA nuclease n=2 Tax=Candidatus Buchananiibacteriota TaxID=1817903 RepID=A0A1G1YR78_9BACT|nr:MAG: hypothetical protein A2744_01125 [Candidatus Buchananbacteria bacterium RIFCSPHIGHO2_01_FULL_44_11]OGY54831.1 MAG: hypothetical protein A3A24_02755 [Candidatus Buchananbacteria bacterium RIFCSPLOWO2_01_FULL_46_12]